MSSLQVRGSSGSFRRGAAATAVLVVTAGLSAYGSRAEAAPKPTIASVQAKINQLTTQFDQVSTQLDQASQQLSSAQTQLTQARTRLADANAKFQAARAAVAQTAAAAFEDSGVTSVSGILTSGNAGSLLQEGALLQEQSGNHSAQASQLLAAASQQTSAEQQAQRTEDGVAQLTKKLGDQKKSLGQLVATQKATLDSLTTSQQETVQSNSIGGSGATTTATYDGPTSTQAEKAVAFVYAQLGKPYQWGATGPSSFDCSGLVQAAWRAAGVSIPRDTYGQWAALQHIPQSGIQPGDLLYYDGVGHVTMYVGNGYMIDAPQTGKDVEKIPMNNSWYSANFVGAARP